MIKSEVINLDRSFEKSLDRSFESNPFTEKKSEIDNEELFMIKKISSNLK